METYQRGTSENEEMEKSTYEYFCSVLEFAEKQFDDEEDKEIYFRNVFKAMKEHELQLICHPRLSYGVANVMSFADDKQLLLLLKIMRDNISFLAGHPCGSHVLQSALEIALTRIATSGKDDDHELLIKMMAKFGTLVRENLDEMLKCSQSCHVICTMLEVLSGCKASDHLLKGKKSRGNEQKGSKKGQVLGLKGDVQVPENFSKVLTKLVDNLMETEDLDGVLAEPCSSLVVQTALFVLNKCDPKTCHKLVEVLMSKLFDDSTDVLKLISTAIYSPLVEKIIEALTPEQYTSFLERHVKGKLKEICLDPFANFVAQTLLRNCPSKAELEKMFEELEPSWSDISNVRHLGVLAALSSACAKLGSCQAKFVQRTCELLRCSEPNVKELFVPLVIRWLHHDDFTNERNKNMLWKFNYFGLVVAQNMLKFQKPFVVTESLLKMQPKDLVHVFCHTSGSYLLDAFAESTTVSRIKKNLLIKQLKGNFTRLACDKYGSRCIEKLWKHVDVQGKVSIVEDLAQNEFKLKDSMFGTFVYKAFAVDMYKRRPNDWTNLHNQGTKRKEMFKDILQPKSQKKPKHKKQRLV